MPGDLCLQVGGGTAQGRDSVGGEDEAAITVEFGHFPLLGIPAGGLAVANRPLKPPGKQSYRPVGRVGPYHDAPQERCQLPTDIIYLVAVWC